LKLLTIKISCFFFVLRSEPLTLFSILSLIARIRYHSQNQQEWSTAKSGFRMELQAPIFGLKWKLFGKTPYRKCHPCFNHTNNLCTGPESCRRFTLTDF
jgi:hypothetical protein